MNKLLFFLLFFFQILNIQAQSGSKNSIEQNFLDDPDFNVFEFPQKWNNESGVILCEKQIYNYSKSGSIAIQNEVVRRRIKLLDKSAVNLFSEIYFKSAKTIKFIVIKPDGASNEIDLSDAVTITEEITIPSIFRSNFKNINDTKIEYTKLAVPGLEVNDIIDYYYISESSTTLSNLTYQYAFPSVYTSMYSTYPTLKRKMEIQVLNSLYLNVKSQNGAPEFIEEPNTTKSNFKIYTLEDKLRDKLDEERWMNPYRNTPTVKFQVSYIKDPRKSNYYYGEQGVAKRKITGEEILDKIQRQLYQKNTFITSFQSNFKAWINVYMIERRLEKISYAELVKQAYYYYRHYRYFNNEGYSLAKQYEKNDYFLFLQTLTATLQSNNLHYTLVVTAPTDITSLSDAVFSEELTCFIKIIMDNREYYLFPPDVSSCFNELPENYGGAEGYELTLNTDPLQSGISMTTLPKHIADNNSLFNSLKLTIDTIDISKIGVKRTVIATGLNKRYYEYIINYYKAIRKEFNQYNSVVYGTLNFYEEEKEHTEKSREKLKEEIKSEYDLLEYINYDLTHDGRGNIKNPVEEDDYSTNYLKFEDEFILKGLVKKVGKNYFLEVGNLIGKQTNFSDDDLQRKSDVHYIPRSYNNEIVIQLPVNYTVEGLSNLTMDVNNSSGHFTSYALIDGNQLIVRSYKSYNNYTERKEDWQKLLEFTSAASKFYQAKVLLKKIE